MSRTSTNVQDLCEPEQELVEEKERIRPDSKHDQTSSSERGGPSLQVSVRRRADQDHKRHDSD